jgi:alkanesulfonate monooxygenase SsuD/methylene tetrahydromethanopterin reductase-like flavin-dependent oxidoreductase (luciferase family)
VVGSHDEAARAFQQFKNSGISRFLIRGWSSTEEISSFGTRVLPLVREMSA